MRALHVDLGVWESPGENSGHSQPLRKSIPIPSPSQPCIHSPIPGPRTGGVGSILLTNAVEPQRWVLGWCPPPLGGECQWGEKKSTEHLVG